MSIDEMSQKNYHSSISDQNCYFWTNNDNEFTIKYKSVSLPLRPLEVVWKYNGAFLGV